MQKRDHAARLTTDVHTRLFRPPIHGDSGITQDTVVKLTPHRIGLGVVPSLHTGQRQCLRRSSLRYVLRVSPDCELGDQKKQEK
jgi:hypothetical protein